MSDGCRDNVKKRRKVIEISDYFKPNKNGNESKQISMSE
jgi:hypothetical protein